ESGYIPQRLERKSGIQGLHRIEEDLPIRHSVYAILDNIPNHEPMLDLLLKYNVYGGELTKEQLKMAYDRCYDDYLYFLNTEKEFKSGKITLTINEQKSLNGTLSSYIKHCSDGNSTFKSVKEFLAWANSYEMDYYLYSILGRDNPEKVIYKNSNKINNKSTNKE
ncbi:hypothetical protein CRN67_05890, partial [Campylobacter blaseri]